MSANFKKILALALASVLALFALVSCGGKGGDTTYTFSTGGSTGTYYGFTTAVAGVLTDKVEGAKFTAVTSGGSKANIEAIDDGDAQYAIVQNDVMLNAYNGVNNFEGNQIRSFAVVGTVYPEVCQIIAAKSANINSVADLAGKRVSVGDVGSGVVTNAEQILAAAGLTFDDIQVQNLGVGPSADAIKAGTLDAFFFTAGIPTTAITELDTSNTEMTVVSLSDNEIASLTSQYPHYVRAEITNEHYPKSIAAGAPAVTIAVKATYIADATLSEDAVYAMTKALWENREAIAAAHNTGKAMDIKTALLGIGAAPVHAGAMRYYEEYLASHNTANGTSLSFKDFYGYTK
ncbi:MAG: TAXI family TRAP transporter solute-binding subunit [Clostridia bacterium]|nr:TAXI family TRAP transporter solute-binding subunit [Clostridia bacterium]